MTRLVVYVDVLLVVNLLIDYLLLLLTKAVLRKPVRRVRLLAGALIGAAYALTIFLPALPFPVYVLLHLAVLTAIVAAAFSLHGIRDFIKTACAFFGVNFLFAGLMLALYLFYKPAQMLYQNGVVYFDLDIRLLLALTLLCYAALTVLTRLLRRKAPDDRLFDVVLCSGGKSIREKALLDTGHGLSDGFSDRTVVVAEPRVVRFLAPETISAFLADGAPPTGAAPPVRLIPYASVGREGVLRAFLLDSVQTVRPACIQRSVWLAESPRPFAGGEYAVLLSADFLERGEKNHAEKAKSAARAHPKRAAARRHSLHKRPADPAGATEPRRGGGAAPTARGRGDAGPGGFDNP